MASSNQMRRLNLVKHAATAAAATTTSAAAAAAFHNDQIGFDSNSISNWLKHTYTHTLSFFSLSFFEPFYLIQWAANNL